MADPLVRHVSDTAQWVAYYRAEESDRPDAIFRDSFARALAGERGEQIARTQGYDPRNAWPFTARTYLIDKYVRAEVQRGADLIVNLAAGLDTRPYRMALPPTLRWVEIDLPGIFDYKEEILDGAGARPVCRIDRVRLDLSDQAARRPLFAELGRSAARAVILTEGLLIYLDREQVGALARDLHEVPRFHRWICDVANPAVLKVMLKQGAASINAVAPFKFTPAEGPDFFAAYGWRAFEVGSILKAAGQIKRLSPLFKLFSLLPEQRTHPNRPWSGVCVLDRGD